MTEWVDYSDWAGWQFRPFIHDARPPARSIAMVLAADTDQMQNQIFNVGDSRLNMTILQLAERVRDVCAQYRDVEISVTEKFPRIEGTIEFHSTRFSRFLTFTHRLSSNPGVEEMAHGFLNSRFGNYRDQTYSNLAMTARALSMFQDPVELARLYAPLK